MNKANRRSRSQSDNLKIKGHLPNITVFPSADFQIASVANHDLFWCTPASWSAFWILFLLKRAACVVMHYEELWMKRPFDLAIYSNEGTPFRISNLKSSFKQELGVTYFKFDFLTAIASISFLDFYRIMIVVGVITISRFSTYERILRHFMMSLASW